MTPVTLLSPAPPGTRLDALNRDVAARMEAAGIATRFEAIPLPMSINGISGLPATERAWHLPIVTTADLHPARAGGGPPQHRYDRPCPDLLLAVPLYEVAFGIHGLRAGIDSAQDLRGCRIAVPGWPSAVRRLAEALLFDGWGLRGRVELVELPPPKVQAALEAGQIDATAWNITTVEAGGNIPLLPWAGAIAGARWLPVEQPALDRIHVAQAFRTALVPLDGIPLLSFRQGLAVWRDTPADLVEAIRVAVPGHGAPGDWPGITPDEIAR